MGVDQTTVESEKSTCCTSGCGFPGAWAKEIGYFGNTLHFKLPTKLFQKSVTDSQKDSSQHIIIIWLDWSFILT